MRWASTVEATLRPLANPKRADVMRAYMKSIAPFLGIPAPERRAVMRPLGRPTDDELVAECRALMRLPEREFHYVATETLVSAAKEQPAVFLDEFEWFIRTKSWWDTVDHLASGVGTLATAHPAVVSAMDEWIHDPDSWIARVAILHQLGWRDRTDAARLFRLCLVRAHEKEFFLRKAIGWALRDYAWTNPDAVRTFVDEHRSELSGLTIREASKNLAHPGAGLRH